MSDPAQTIAIVGMAARYPGADGLDSFWQRILAAQPQTRELTPAEFARAGIPEHEWQREDYVKLAGVIEHPERFDPGFFSLLPAQARVTDPQHRVFLELAWAALEDAACLPEHVPGPIGIWAGCDRNQRELVRLSCAPRDMQELIGGGRDYFATRVAYHLDLRGPAVTVQSACSTSLVAAQMACASLLAFECDLALAGGVGIGSVRRGGYRHIPGGILSPDGACRPFDARAAGTLSGDGCGVVVLRRLEDALASGDSIHALIVGAAINNDGARKHGYTVPSVEGQAEVIATALALAELEPATIGLIESHGTGTVLGDPIEVAALDQVLGREGPPVALGALKAMVGHTISAAGIGGLIKAALSVERGQLPPLCNFETPNPHIDFARSRLFVPTRAQPWPPGVRRAGVSAFGFGGTNAHLVLEQAPSPRREPRADGPKDGEDEQLLLVSSGSETACRATAQALRAHLDHHPEQALADVAYTLQIARRRQAYGAWVVCSDRAGARALDAVEVRRAGTPKLAMVFSGQGTQYAGMGAGLYRDQPSFRADIDRLCELVAPRVGIDLRSLLMPSPAELERAEQTLRQTQFTQPALFIFELALAQLWRRLGVEPATLVGHSVGEYVAACLAGVMNEHDALALLLERARLSQAMPHGAMLAVELAPEQLAPLRGLEIAVLNAPAITVLAGPEAEVEAAEAEYAAAGVATKRIRSAHAFHSASMDGMLAPFEAAFAGVKLSAPKLPIVANVTGTWMLAAEARSPHYWVRHVREAVRFSPSIARLARDPDTLFLEVGPGRGARPLLLRHAELRPDRVIRSCRGPREFGSDRSFLLRAAGELSCAGVQVDFEALDRERAQARRRVHVVPTVLDRRPIPWDHEPGAGKASARPQLSVASWIRDEEVTPGLASGRWLVFAHRDAQPWIDALRERAQVIEVWPAANFARRGPDHFALDLHANAQVGELWTTLEAELEGPLTGILHAWQLDASEGPKGLVGLLNLARVCGPVASLCVRIAARGCGDLDVPPRLGASALRGAAQVWAQEQPGVEVSVIDCGPAEDDLPSLRELLAEGPSLVAWRRGHRWLPSLRPSTRLIARPDLDGQLWLVAGGLGQIGRAHGRWLSERGAQVVLLSRRAESELPPELRAELDAWPRPPSLLAADIDSPESVVAALARVREDLPPGQAFAGLVHAAGRSGPGVIEPLSELEPADCEREWKTKVEGLTLLCERVQAQRVIAASSLSTLLGGVGLFAYAASHHALEAACAQLRHAGTPATAIAWDVWGPKGLDAAIAGEMLDAAWAWGARGASLAVTSTSLAARERLAAQQLERHGTRSASPSPRPTTPDSSTRARLEAIWRAVLEVDELGLDVDLFELGGDSLTTIQIKHAIAREFGRELPAAALLERSTLRAQLELLERAPATTPATATTEQRPAVTHFDASLTHESVDEVSRFYDAVSHQLDSGEFGEFAWFLNFGYEGPRRSPVIFDERRVGANMRRLVLELLADAPLAADTRVLDIGCGRGGTIRTLREHFEVGPVTGIDIAPAAIEFCRAQHRFEHTRFLVGNAQQLPLPDASVDLITNLESSHCYPDHDAFLAEVARVLAPGGCFTWSDLLPPARFEHALATLARLGFEPVGERDISERVVASCDRNARRNREAFGEVGDEALLAYFLGMPGSGPYQSMKTGVASYRVYQLRKRP